MNEKISRREFLKKAGLVSAGAVMGNFILSPKSYARVKGANDRVNVAVVGFSDRFRSSLLPGSPRGTELRHDRRVGHLEPAPR